MLYFQNQKYFEIQKQNFKILRPFWTLAFFVAFGYCTQMTACNKFFLRYLRVAISLSKVGYDEWCNDFGASTLLYFNNPWMAFAPQLCEWYSPSGFPSPLTTNFVLKVSISQGNACPAIYSHYRSDIKFLMYQIGFDIEKEVAGVTGGTQLLCPLT